MNFKRHLVLGLALLMTLSNLACSGGGGGGGGSTDSTRTGVFKDSNVEGLAYETSSGHSGVTDANGRYTYDSGDTVTFSIGGVTLGSGAARGVVSPIDLVSGGTASTPQVQNIARFLMMLDNDGNPDNGIVISTDVQAVATGWSQVEFSAGNFDDLVGPIIDDCTDADGWTHELCDPSEAEDHLVASLRCAYSGAFRGTFGGDVAGRFGAVIDAQTGVVRGAAYADGYGLTEGEGTDEISFEQNVQFDIAGFVDAGVEFEGQLSSPDAMSGTWGELPFENGTFSGRRIGGASDATRRFTGVAYTPSGADTGAILAMDVNDANVITGVGYDIEHNRQFTFNGTLSGAAITARTSDGVDIVGTLFPDDTFSGTWTNDAELESGSFDGCGCRLN